MKALERGKTNTQGWEIGIRRTFAISIDRAWDALFMPEALDLWLGDGLVSELKKGEHYLTASGQSGLVRSLEVGRLIRLSWSLKSSGNDATSTLQIRLIPAKFGTTISIHHEKLIIAEQREQMRVHWSATMDQLASLFEAHMVPHGTNQE
jgi:uncharacterized protein YndB with AHSA1/START domain